MDGALKFFTATHPPTRRFGGINEIRCSREKYICKNQALNVHA
jgi:hypothetical protein